MTDRLVPSGDGHTPLSDDDLAGLIPSYISTRSELHEAEQRNIAVALLGPMPAAETLLSDTYLRGLHRRMFGEVWRWAGRYRQIQTNIGIDSSRIPEAVRNLADDTMSWVDADAFEPRETAIRFHHRLVAIHPFPNGNGRHGRVAADLLVKGLGQPIFSWGAALDVSTDELRARYQHALRAMDADPEDVEPLRVFAQS